MDAGLFVVSFSEDELITIRLPDISPEALIKMLFKNIL